MIEVPVKKTPITKEQALSGLMYAWGYGLTREIARGILSLIWIETANGKSLNNKNPGNISASSKYIGKVWRPSWYFEPTPETPPKIVSLHSLMLKGQAPSAFRAYDTLSQGFEDFVSQLKHTFPEVVEAAKSGTPDDFRIALSKKYSHDYRNPASTKTFESLWSTFEPMVSFLPSESSKSVPLVVSGSESQSSGESGQSSICSHQQEELPEGGFIRGQKFSIPGIEDYEPKV